MNYFLYVLWLLSWGIAFLLFGASQSVMHEATALLVAIHGTCCLIGALVVGYLSDMREEQVKAAKAVIDAQPAKGRFITAPTE